MGFQEEEDCLNTVTASYLSAAFTDCLNTVTTSYLSAAFTDCFNHSVYYLV